MEKIKLGSTVIVSDPCYTIPTWCQAVVKNVLPGEYLVNVEKKDFGAWGTRCSILTAIHKDHTRNNKWKQFSEDIGVDSGQCGIFSENTYRNDDYSEGIDFGDGNDLKIEDEAGDKWYSKMCSRTIGDMCWGSYPEGVVSSSGTGDGSYVLSVLFDNEVIVGFMVDFGLYDEEEDFDDEEEDFDDEFDPAGGRGLRSHE